MGSFCNSDQDFLNWFSSTLKGEMGYLGYFYVETKSFEIRSNVEGAVQLAKKSRGKSRSVIMAWVTVLWLVSAWDYLTNNDRVHENW